jgi:hypothetical protein
MHYEVAPEPGYLRATLFGRETVEETRQFVRAVVESNRHHQRGGILMDMRASRPIFHSEPNGFVDYLRALIAGSSWRIALLADNAELRLSHEYLALLGRQHGMAIWSFRDEPAALRWLSNRRRREERREREDRRQRMQLQRPTMASRRVRERRVVWYDNEVGRGLMNAGAPSATNRA